VAGVPIAVPANWSQWVSANMKTLFSFTRVSVHRNRSVGKLSGNLSLCVRMKSWIEDTPSWVSILVYMAVASAEKKQCIWGHM